GSSHRPADVRFVPSLSAAVVTALLASPLLRAFLPHLSVPLCARRAIHAAAAPQREPEFLPQQSSRSQFPAKIPREVPPDCHPRPAGFLPLCLDTNRLKAEEDQWRACEHPTQDANPHTADFLP